MKIFYKVFTVLFAVSLSTASFTQLTPPYSEDFEANDGGWSSSGTLNSWEWGTPAANYITASAPCDGGTNAWVTNLTGEYNDGELSYLTSPEFDFSALSADPTLAFQHIYSTESCCDYGWVEFSTDGGSNWTKVGTSGTGQNWYNDGSLDVWNDNSAGGSGNWQTASNVLTGTAGLASVMIRFVFESDGSVIYDGFGVDNISITETYDNAGVIAVTSPASACGLTAAEIVEAEIMNTGTSTINSIDICYSINGGAPVCETVTATIMPGNSIIHVFAATADFSTPGSYDLTVSTNLTGDSYACDDAMSVTIESQMLVATFPYSEDFESGTGGWLSYGTSNSWQLGAADGSYIYGSSGCGSNVWSTNLTGDYNDDETSFVESPCFDFSGLTSDPIIVFDHLYATESCCDHGWLEYSIDGGANWVTLGTAGSGQNWYNDFSGDVWNDYSVSGAGNWQTASNTLTGLAGEANVKFRMAFTSDGSVTDDGFGFDNIMITETFDNAGPVALLTPVAGCGLTSAEIVEVEIANTGFSTINSIDVCYQVNSGTAVCETAAITINAGTSAVYAFTVPADLSVAGTYEIKVYTSLAGDVFICDDTAYFTIESQPVIASLPYTEDFESGAGGWLTYGNGNSWELGTPAASYISSSDPCLGGNNAWVTNLSGEYNDNELSFVESPCFDFSALTVDPVIVFSHTYITEACCDYGWVEFSIDGGANWNTLGTAGTGQNWYNDINNYWNDQSAAGSGNWQTAYNDLTGLAGESSVKLRFVFESDGSVIEEGFGFDNIMIVPSAIDVQADSVGYTQACSYSNAETITGHFFNNGTAMLASVDVCYTVNGGAPVCEAATGPLMPGAVYSHVFTATADLSAEGNYDVVVYVNEASGINKCDDSTMVTIVYPFAVDLTDSVLCAGADLVINSYVTDATYLWSTTETTDAITVNTPGQYYVDVTDNATGCLSTDTIEVTLTDIVLTAVATNEILGNDATIDLTVTNGSGPYSYDWDNGQTTEDLGGLTAGTYEVIVTDAYGCMDSVSVSMISEVGVSENNLPGFEVYPNPAGDVLNIKPVFALNQVVFGQLSDASGRAVTVFTVSGDTMEVLDLSGIERGVYFLSLQVNGEVLVTKVIKQ